MDQNKKGFSTAALVLGILAVVFLFIPGVPGWLCLIISIVGLVLAAKGMRINPAGQSGHGMAVAGLVLCIISLVLSLIAVVCIIGACATLGAIGGVAALA